MTLAARLKWLIGVVAALLFLGSWGAVIAIPLLGLDRQSWVIAVTAAAFATEGLFWAGAAILGVSVFEARRRIWRGLRRLFGGG